MRFFESGFRPELEGRLKRFADSLEPVLFDEGAEILPPTEKPGSVAFVVEGLVIAEARVRMGGRVSTPAYSVFGDLSWLGLECLMDGGCLGYRAAVATRAAVFPVSYVMEEINSDLLLAVMAQMADRNYESMSRNISNRSSLPSRLLITLLLVRSMTSLPEVSLTLADLASLTGASRTRLTPVMKEFEAQGLVERGYRNYMIASTPDLLDALKELESGERESGG